MVVISSTLEIEHFIKYYISATHLKPIRDTFDSLCMLSVIKEFQVIPVSLPPDTGITIWHAPSKPMPILGYCRARRTFIKTMKYATNIS